MTTDPMIALCDQVDELMKTVVVPCAENEEGRPICPKCGKYNGTKSNAHHCWCGKCDTYLRGERCQLPRELCELAVQLAAAYRTASHELDQYRRGNVLPEQPGIKAP